jgi:polar amino acid transport system substrate-binding protein
MRARRIANAALLRGGTVAAIAAAAVGVAGCGSSAGTSASALVSKSCKPEHQFSTLHKGQLTVSTYNFPPSTIVESGNKLGGIEGQILTKIASEECLKMNIAVASGSGVIPAVQSGRADVASGDWTLTVPRVKVLSHSIPFYNEPMVLLSKSGQARSIPDLKGKTVGTAQGNFWDDALNGYLGGSLKEYQSGLQAYQDLSDGRIQVVVDGLIGATQYMKGHSSAGLKVEIPQPLAGVPGSQHEQKVFYLTHGNKAMVTAFNADLQQMLASGYVKRLISSNGLPPTAAEVNGNIVLQ